MGLDRLPIDIYSFLLGSPGRCLLAMIAGGMMLYLLIAAEAGWMDGRMADMAA